MHTYIHVCFVLLALICNCCGKQTGLDVGAIIGLKRGSNEASIVELLVEEEDDDSDEGTDEDECTANAQIVALSTHYGP